MDTDSSDEDSAKSIPRPIYEAISAIESPQPNTSSGKEGTDNLTATAGTTTAPIINSSHSKQRNKYMVTTTTNASASGNANDSNGASAASSALTMKLTKVTTTNHHHHPVSTSTPKDKEKEKEKEKEKGGVRMTRDLILLQRSHNQSEMLSECVSGRLKTRRKSRLIPAASMTLATAVNNPPPKHRPKKRSKSIPTPVNDSDEDWVSSLSFTRKKRVQSMAYEVAADGSMTMLLSEDSKSSGAAGRSGRRPNMRSENEKFAKKHSAFLDNIINDPIDDAIDASVGALPLENSSGGSGEWNEESLPTVPVSEEAADAQVSRELEQRLNEIWQPPPKEKWDPYCWKCLLCGNLMACSKCLRSYHNYCVRPATIKFDSTWKCPECVLLDSAPKRPRRNEVTVELLSQLLSFALERMKLVRGVYKLRSVQEVLPQTFRKYFVNPVSFAGLAKRIRNRAFHSVEEFVSEVKWLQHNALILDRGDVKVVQACRAVVKVCRQEANEIDTCAECYLNANSSDEWFVKVCTQPHLLLWAKLKSFPYWPAKAMGIGANGLINVRFFGKHDRANVPAKDCFLYSLQDPNTQTSRRSARELAECIREVEVHIKQICNKFGSFNYANFRTPLDIVEEQQQLEQMIPGVSNFMDRQLEPANKTPLQFLIRKTAGDKLSIVKKSKAAESSGNESDHPSSPSKVQPVDSAQGVTSTTNTSASIAPPSESHGKAHSSSSSSNYEVIPKHNNLLSESRGCTVILKRKSLEAGKVMRIFPQEDAAPRIPLTTDSLMVAKRKHSDNSSEGSHQSEVRAKNARRVQEENTEEQSTTQPSQDIVATSSNIPSSSEQVTSVTTATTSSNSVVEMVRRRQGITITKIPRDQQAKTEADAPQPPAPQPQPVATPTAVRVDEMERQQQQLISKVVPFVEVKTEDLSDQEETPVQEDVVEKEPQPESVEAPPVAASTVLQAAVPLIQCLPLAAQIKEEIVSDDDEEIASQSEETQQLQPAPPPLPPPAVPPVAIVASSSGSSSLQTAPSQPADSFVRFVGDTTIQRLPGKQTTKQSEINTSTTTTITTSTTAKRGSMRGAIHGPLPASAQMPVVTAPPQPSKSTNSSAKSMATTVKIPPPIPQTTSARPKQVPASTTTTTTQVAPPPVTTTANLLKSSMVVIPVDIAQSQHHQRSPTAATSKGNSNNNNSNNNTSNSHSNNGSNNLITTVPVPPLTAVSKNALQSTATTTVPISVAAPQQPSPQAPQLPPPPLAGISTDQTLLANALNGMSATTEALSSSSSASGSASGSTVLLEATEPPPMVAPLASDFWQRNGPPRLTPRPRGPLQFEGGSIFPTHNGPVYQRLREKAHKITDYFIWAIQDTFADMANVEPGVNEARIGLLMIELENVRANCERQIGEAKRNCEQTINEMRKTMEAEKKRIMNEVRQQCMVDRIRAVEETKKKQWCAHCAQEAQLYCCWNTSYCDYPCQQLHWEQHSATCGQAPHMQHLVQSQQQQQQQQQHEVTTRTKQKQPQQQPAPPPPPTGNSPHSFFKPGNVPNNPADGNRQQRLINVINSALPYAPSTELLKLPNNTYLRPVSGNMQQPQPTLASPASTLITAAPHNHNNHGGGGGGQRHPIGYGGKPPQQPTPMPVQRYNIPLSISSTNNPAAYGMLNEHLQQQQQQVISKSFGRNSSSKPYNRGRSNYNSSSSNNNNANNNSGNHIGGRPGMPQVLPK